MAAGTTFPGGSLRAGFGGCCGVGGRLILAADGFGSGLGRRCIKFWWSWWVVLVSPEEVGLVRRTRVEVGESPRLE